MNEACGGERRDTQIGVVIHKKIKMRYLCFIYIPVFTVSLVLESANEVLEATPPSLLHSAQVPSEPSHSTPIAALPISPTLTLSKQTAIMLPPLMSSHFVAITSAAAHPLLRLHS